MVSAARGGGSSKTLLQQGKTVLGLLNGANGKTGSHTGSPSQVLTHAQLEQLIQAIAHLEPDKPLHAGTSLIQAHSIEPPHIAAGAIHHSS